MSSAPGVPSHPAATSVSALGGHGRYRHLDADEQLELTGAALIAQLETRCARHLALDQRRWCVDEVHAKGRWSFEEGGGEAGERGFESAGVRAA